MRALLRILPLIVPAVRLAWGLMRDRRVRAPIKALPVLALLYALSPLDLLPDIVPVVGWVDDLIVSGSLLLAFFLLSPWHVVLEHIRGRAEDPAPDDEQTRTVEGTYRYLDDEPRP
ncbi:MAG: YkvA family protein [Dehalococcoidia bacterium]